MCVCGGARVGKLGEGSRLVIKLLRSHSSPFVPLEGAWEPFSWWHRGTQEQAIDSCSVVMATVQARQGLGDSAVCPYHVLFSFCAVSSPPIRPFCSHLNSEWNTLG